MHLSPSPKTRNLRRDLLPLPIPTLAPPLLIQSLDDLAQPLGCKCGAEQLLRRGAGPKALAETGLDGAWMQSYAHGLVAHGLAKINIQALGQLVDGGLAGTIRIPAAGRIIRNGPHASRHEREDRRGGEVGGPGHRGAAFREERREVLDQEQGPKRVDLKRRERVLIGDGRGRFFRMKNAGDAKGEPEGGVWETGFAVRRRGGNGGLVCPRIRGSVGRIGKVEGLEEGKGVHRSRRA